MLLKNSREIAPVRMRCLVVKVKPGAVQNNIAWNLECQVHVFVVKLLSHVFPFAIPRTAAGQASLSLAISQSLLKLMSIEFVMPSKHSHPLLSLSVPVFNLACRGPAPADPGYSKERWRRRRSGNNRSIKR